MTFNQMTDTAEPLKIADPCILDMLGRPPGTLARHLDLHDAREIINASAFATSQGKPHLVHATIRWDHCIEFSLRDWLHHQGRLLDKLTRWLLRNGVPVAYLWVREVGRINGAHTHLLVHLPVEHWAACKDFLLTSGGFERGRDASGEAIRFEGNAYGTKTPRMRAGHVRYLLKSLDPNATVRAPADQGGTGPLPAALGIRVDDHRLPITGKRCGVSYSIGATMRRDFGWQEIASIADLRHHLHP